LTQGRELLGIRTYSLLPIPMAEKVNSS
jgi:hypothetical protein